MPKRVRIEGDPEIYEVLAETPFLKLLVNRPARHRQTVESLTAQLADASRRLQEAELEQPDDEAPADAAAAS